MVFLEKLYIKQPEDRIEELTMVDIKGDVFDLEECLLSWKQDIASIVFDAKSKQQREVQDSKGKKNGSHHYIDEQIYPELIKASGSRVLEPS